MNINAEVSVIFDNTRTSFETNIPVNPDYVNSSYSSIMDWIANSKEMYKLFGYTPDYDEFDVKNMTELTEKLPAPMEESHE